MTDTGTPSGAGSRWFWPGMIALAAAAAGVAFLEARPSSTADQPAASGPDPAVQLLPDPGPAEPLGTDEPSPVADDATPTVTESPVPVTTPTATTPPAGTLPPAPTTPATPAPTLPPATPTAPPALATGIDCTSTEGWTVTYPADWYTVGGEWACTAFAPWPFEAAEATDVAIFSLTFFEPLDDTLLTAVPDNRELLDWYETEVDGVRMVAVVLEELEDAFYSAGTIIYDVYVDNGATTVMFETWHEGGDAPWYGDVVDQMVFTFRPSPG